MENKKISLIEVLPFLPEYVFLLAPDFRILWHNNGLKGIEPEKSYCFQVVHGKESPPEGCPALKAIKERRPVKAVMKAEALGKDFYVSVVPIVKEERVTALWHLAVDVSQKNTWEHDLSYYTYEIIGQLAAGLSHDIKNMLTAALGELEILTLMARNQPNLKRRYQKITNILQEISNFTQKLCHLGNTKNQAELLNLNQVISDLASLIKALSPKNIKLHFYIDPYIGNIYMNRAIVEQIILNLVLNALHAIEDTGQVTISTAKKENYVLLIIEDTGVGIKKDLVKRIFDPYFTTKESGSGLGLTLVKRFVEEAGGKIKVSSQEGVGSRFEVWLPTVTD